MCPPGLSRTSLRAFMFFLVAAFAGLLAGVPASAHEGHTGHAVVAADVSPVAAPPVAASAAAVEPLADEPVIPGVDWATDFQVAPDGDVYVAGHGGEIRRYERIGGTVANPRYELKGELIWKFSVTKQVDRGLIGIALDSAFGSGQRYLYALLTRGSSEYVGQASGAGSKTIRRTAQLVKLRIPASGPPLATDLTVILGTDAPPDPDASCKPYTAGQAAAAGETDALPNGVGFVPESVGGDGIAPDFTEAHIFPDGDLTTRGDGAYDCIPTDGDTHGPGTVASAPDGSLFVSIGDSTLFSPPQNAALRTQNLESYVGKVLHVDRNGKGVGSHPFCSGEADLTRICTKIWAIGLRNAFRVQLLAPDGASGGQPALAVGDVGNYTMERLTIAHPGDNLGWPCWEGSYFNYDFSGPGAGSALRTGWGGPALLPVGPGRTSCEHKTATGSGSGFPAPSSDIVWPTIEYQHEQDPVTTPQEMKDSGGNNGAAIVAGGTVEAKPGADPAVALPAAWTGSLLFGDYVRGWINRVSPDPADPTNADHDAGLLVPKDQGRDRPTLQTDFATGRVPDPLLERIASPPPVIPPAELPPYFRLTMRQGPDGSLWYLRYSGRSQAGGLYRLRTAPTSAAAIESVSGSCATGSQTQGPITLTAQDAGAGATYSWDTDGDGVSDAGRSGRSTTLTAAQLAALAGGGTNWVRVFVSAGTSRSVAARYVCAGKTPDVSISSPANNTEVVLGEPTVVSATRPAGDAAASGVPDSLLRWKAETVHGSSHTHALVDTTTPFENVGGVQKMQVTLRPDSTHDLGSYTQVRIYAPQADGNGVAQSIRLVPKSVSVTLGSAPAGAQLTMLRDGPSTVVTAPGSFQAAAGYATSISAPLQFTAGGETYFFQRWSDGAASLGRPWRVPAGGGAAPVAEYAEAPPETTPPTSPVDTTPTTPPTSPPTTPIDLTPTAPAPRPEEPAPATPPLPGAPVPPVIPPPGPPVLLAPTSLELATAPLVVSAVRGKGSKVTGVKATIDLGRRVAASGLIVKVALRDARCRWWVFGRKRFGGRPATGAKRSASRACVEAPSWKHVASTWSGEDAVATVNLNSGLPRGRYALRLRVQQGSTKLAERVRAVVVK